MKAPSHALILHQTL